MASWKKHTVPAHSQHLASRQRNGPVPMSVGPYLQNPGRLGYSGVPVVTGHAGPFMQTPPVMVQPGGYVQGMPGGYVQGMSGGYVQGMPAVKPPSTHRKLSIGSLCCFFPIGIIAIYFSCQTDAAIRRMDYNKAKSKSRIALVLSLVCIVNGFIFFAAFAVCGIDSAVRETKTRLVD